MSQVWDPDVNLSPESAAQLIDRQFPAFAPARLKLLGNGWDNTAFLVNEAYVFRFPRREGVVELLEREMRVLPLLARHLPLPISVATLRGAPSAGYPYAFAGHPWIPGTTACGVAWSEEDRARNAAPLGHFLAALHRMPVSDETRAWVPGEEELRSMSPLRERLHALAPGVPGMAVEGIADLADQLDVPPVGVASPGWVHGDLYARHLLVDEQRLLCGVIDWGDVHLGNPAIDLMAAFSFLPHQARDVFRSAYGPIDAAIWDRARCHALHYGVSLIEYGDAIGDAALRAAGEYALRSAGPA